VSERTDTIEARLPIVALRPWSVKSTGAPHDELWFSPNWYDFDVSGGRARVRACWCRFRHNQVFETFQSKAITHADADPDHWRYFHSDPDGNSDRHPDCDYNAYSDRHPDGNFNAYSDYDCDPDFKAYRDANFNPWPDRILGNRRND